MAGWDAAKGNAFPQTLGKTSQDLPLRPREKPFPRLKRLMDDPSLEGRREENSCDVTAADRKPFRLLRPTG